jgi:phage/plasmid-associated DNA primase
MEQLIGALLGKSNVSGETLDRLLHEKFAIGNFYHKMANVDADVSADVILNNTGIIKKLTGNDVHTGEYKFKNPFKFVNYARLIFFCNRTPETEDDTDVFYRRPIVINLTTQFFGDKPTPRWQTEVCCYRMVLLIMQSSPSRPH